MSDKNKWHIFSRPYVSIRAARLPPYRRKDRRRSIIGDRCPPSPLDSVQPERWPARYTEDLLNLLHVLCLLTELEPAQADLL